jgi:hypothetical protein
MTSALNLRGESKDLAAADGEGAGWRMPRLLGPQGKEG